MTDRMLRVRVVDSHTEGEPTRVVLAGGPALGDGPLSVRAERLRTVHDEFRRAIVGAPRGSEGMVGALLCPPDDPVHTSAVIFFNNVGYLGMCGHGTIGLVATLAHLGRIGVGRYEIETPVGPVSAELRVSGEVAVGNVVSRRTRARVRLEVPGFPSAIGDVAWGGNWFFLTESAPCPLRRENLSELSRYALAVRAALAGAKITGDGGAPIDHVELSGPPVDRRNSARNFVLCPDGAYDRSPCGTGTSAAMACRYADGRLAPGERWRQEGILGGVFEGSVEPVADGVRPTISGRAFLTADSELLIDPDDPFGHGVPP